MPLPPRALVALGCCPALSACGGGHHGATDQPNPSAGGPPSSSSSTTTTPQRAAPARLRTCAPTQLRLRVVSSQGAAGHLEATFAFRNSSSSRCRLFGFPGAQMLSPTRRPLRTIVERGDGFFSFPRHPTAVLRPDRVADPAGEPEQARRERVRVDGVAGAGDGRVAAPDVAGDVPLGAHTQLPGRLPLLVAIRPRGIRSAARPQVRAPAPP